MHAMSTDDESPEGGYAGQVGDIIAAQPRESSYRPAVPVELFVRDRRAPRSLDELAPIERRQLERMFRGQNVAQLLATGMQDDEGDEYPLDLEVAVVVDDKGAPRYRLWGMNYGAVYLMAAESLECIAFAAQHDLEHWHEDQREVFWAMDRAVQRRDHGFGQPMKFCWWDDSCWAKIADAPRGSVQSEPYIRAQFSGES
jgi:hypothetical protein